MKVVHINLTGTAIIEKPLTIYIGYFDSLHLGRQKLIEGAKRVAAKRNTRCALITSDPDPWYAVRGSQDIVHIIPTKQRIRVTEAMGIGCWIILDFSREMADLAPQDFHEKVFKPLRLDTLVCGYDFHHERRGEDDAQSLHEQTGFDVHVTGQASSEHRKVSSPCTEELIQGGDMERAARFMGR